MKLQIEESLHERAEGVCTHDSALLGLPDADIGRLQAENHARKVKGRPVIE